MQADVPPTAVSSDQRGVMTPEVCLQEIMAECTRALQCINQRSRASVPNAENPLSASLSPEASAQVDADELTLSELEARLSEAIESVVPREWLPSLALASSAPARNNSQTDDDPSAADLDEDLAQTSNPQTAALCASAYGVLAQLLRARQTLIARYGVSKTREGLTRGESAPTPEDPPRAVIDDESFDSLTPPPVSPLYRSHAHHHVRAQLDTLRQREEECLDAALSLERSSMLAVSGAFVPGAEDGEEVHATSAADAGSGPRDGRSAQPASSTRTGGSALSASPSLTSSAAATITSDRQLLTLSLRRGQHAAEHGDGATAAEDFALLHSLLFHKLLLVEELIGYALACAEGMGESAAAKDAAEKVGDAQAATEVFHPGEHFMLPPGLDEEDYVEERLHFAKLAENASAPPESSSESSQRQRAEVVQCLRMLLAKVHADALPLRTIETRFRLLLTSAIVDGRAAIGTREPSLFLAEKARDDESLMPSLQGSATRLHAARGDAATPVMPSHFSLTVLLGQLAWNTAYCEWVNGDIPQARDWLLAMNLPKLVRRTRTAMHRYAVDVTGVSADQHRAETAHDDQEDPLTSRLDVPTLSWERVLSGRALHASVALPTAEAATPPDAAATAQQLDKTLTLLQRASTLLAVCDVLLQCRSTDDVVYMASTLSTALAQLARQASSDRADNTVHDVMAEALLLLNHCIEHLLSKRVCKLYLARCAAKEEEKRTSQLMWGSRTDVHAAAYAMMEEDTRHGDGHGDDDDDAALGTPGSLPSGSAWLDVENFLSEEDSTSGSDSSRSSACGGVNAHSTSQETARGAIASDVAKPIQAAAQAQKSFKEKEKDRPRGRRVHHLLTAEEHKALEEEAVRLACDELVFAITGGALPTLESLESHGVPLPGAVGDAASTAIVRPGLSVTLATNALSGVLNYSAYYCTCSHYQALRSATQRGLRRQQHRQRRAAHHARRTGSRSPAIDKSEASEQADADSLMLSYVEASYVGRTAHEPVTRPRRSTADSGAVDRVARASGESSTARRDGTRPGDGARPSGGGGWFDMMRDAATGLLAAVVPPSPPATVPAPSGRTRSAASGVVLPGVVTAAAGAVSSRATAARHGGGRGGDTTTTTSNTAAAAVVEGPFGALRLPSCQYTTGGVVLFPHECTERLSTPCSSTASSSPPSATTAGRSEADTKPEVVASADREECCLRVLTLLQRYRQLSVGLAPTSVSATLLAGGGSGTSASNAQSVAQDAAPAPLVALDDEMLLFISQELNKAVHLLPTAVQTLTHGATGPAGDAGTVLEDRLVDLQRLYVHALAEAGDADRRRLGSLRSGHRRVSAENRRKHRYHHHPRRSPARGRPGLAEVWRRRCCCVVPQPPRVLLEAVTRRPATPPSAPPPPSNSHPAAALSFAQVVASSVQDAVCHRGEVASVPGLWTPAARGAAGDGAETHVKPPLGSLWWGKPLVVPKPDELEKKQAEQRSKPDPRKPERVGRLFPRRRGESGRTSDEDDPHRTHLHGLDGNGGGGLAPDSAALLAFAAPPVFLPEIAIDFSGFTTSSVQVQHATRQMVQELQEAQAAAEAAAVSPHAKANVRGVSMLTPACRLLLHNELPMLQQYSNWRLIYSTRLHGMSMQTILRCCRKEQDEYRWRNGGGGLPSWQSGPGAAAASPPGPPMLLVMELPPSSTFGFSSDDRGVQEVLAAQRNPHLPAATRPQHRMIIGAYLSDMLVDDSRRYYGTSDTFVFQLLIPGVEARQAGDPHAVSAPQLRAYHGCFGENTHFINVRHAPDSIVIGGGGGGSSLYLDDTLAHGATSSCATFASPPLTEWLENGSPAADGTTAASFVDDVGSRSFDIIQLEVLVMDG